MATYWEKYVEEPRKSAQVIMDHAYPGNLEATVTCDLLLAQARASEDVLRKAAENASEATNASLLGVPKTTEEQA